jgi:hypothetical protein
MTTTPDPSGGPGFTWVKGDIQIKFTLNMDQVVFRALSPTQRANAEALARQWLKDHRWNPGTLVPNGRGGIKVEFHAAPPQGVSFVASMVAK